MASMKIAAFLLLGMVLVASAADVAKEEEVRPAEIKADKVMPAAGYPYADFDNYMMMMHQRRLQQWGFGSSANAGATAQAGPGGASASAFANSASFGNGYGWGAPYRWGYNPYWGYGRRGWGFLWG